MGSTSFLGFSCPNLLHVFLSLLFWESVKHFFASLGTFSWSSNCFFSLPYFGLACDHVNSFLSLARKSNKEKILDRGQNVFLCEDNDNNNNMADSLCHRSFFSSCKDITTLKCYESINRSINRRV